MAMGFWSAGRLVFCFFYFRIFFGNCLFLVHVLYTYAQTVSREENRRDVPRPRHGQKLAENRPRVRR